jgi:hypothetical protein
MGLNVWQPRAFRHPALSLSTTLIAAEPLRVNARCVVLLFINGMQPEPINTSEQKILNGMLSVLELLPEELMLARIYSKEADLELVAANIQQWAPATVLQLSMELPAINVQMHLTRTFSPEYLMQNVQHKSTAYKDLLTLRKILHHGTS